MSKKGRFIFFSTLLLLVGLAHAQRKKDSTGYITQEIDNSFVTTSGLGSETFFNFRNVNRIPYYYDHAKRQEILELHKLGDKVALRNALEAYVSNFGIRNFSEDTEFFWTLAQLYEEAGMAQRAKAAYRLVLKHHKKNAFPEIKKFLNVQIHLDEINQDEEDLYVPLDYYYELVEYRKDVDTLIPPQSVLLNMGPEVNSRTRADYGASISTTDRIMIMTKKTLDKSREGNRHGDYFYSEDLFISQGHEDGWWDEAVRLPEPINTKCNEGSACITPDGKELFFARCRIEENLIDCSDCLGSCDIYYSQKDDKGKWSKPVNLGPQINTVAWESHPSLSTDGDTLYFASNRPGGFGLSDIWYTYKLGRKKGWAPAKNMGPVINTAGNEFSPFMDSHNRVFYFSSNGQNLNFSDIDNKKPFRTLDIYKVHISEGHWMEPKNIGPLVNGDQDEYYFSLDLVTNKLYYAKTEEGAEDKLITDIFSFPMPMGAQPTATVRLHGTLEDSETGEAYKGIVSVIDLENGIEVAPKETREDGSFDFDLIDHQRYLLIIQGDEFFRMEKLFYLDGDTTIESKATSVRNRKLQFTSIVFENGKSEILSNMEEDLWNVINFLIDNPGFDLEIGGHTDGDGNEDANLRLSQSRADAIKKFIEDNGNIEPDRVKAVGYGSTQPLREEEITDEDKQINRRVEFQIKYNGNNENVDTSTDEEFEEEEEEEEEIEEVGTGNSW